MQNEVNGATCMHYSAHVHRALTRFNDAESPTINYTCVSCARHAMCRNVCACSDVSKLEHEIQLYMFWARATTRAVLHCAPTLAAHSFSSLSYFSPAGQAFYGSCASALTRASDSGRRVNKVQFICLILGVCDLPLANTQYQLDSPAVYLVLNNTQAT
jgi:hypothetical protein